MTMTHRRRLLGLLAAMPLALRATPAPATRLRPAIFCLVGQGSVLGLAEPGIGQLGVELAPPGALPLALTAATGREFTSGATLAPWGWDTLENVR